MKKFKKWVLDSGMSQNKVAEELGISKSTLSRYFSGERRISVGNALKIEKLTKGKISCKDLA